MRIRRLPKKTFDYIYSRVPRVCVDLVIKTDKGILLTKRIIPPSKGFWHFPGGTVFHGETLSQAGKRIGKEELGINLNIEKTLGIIEYFGESDVGGHAVTTTLLATIKSGKLQGSEQAKEVEFFKKIPENTISEVKKFLASKFKIK